MNKKYCIFLILILVFVFLITRLLWLSLGLFLIVLTYTLFSLRKTFFKEKVKANWLFSIITIISVFIIAISIRIFVFEIYSIPSGSMEDTLIAGDKILVNKLIYGPRLPGSPYDIPVLNLYWYLNASASRNSDSVYWNYCRLKGYSKIKRGDIIVFSFPKNRNSFFVKRCIGLPGDTIQVDDGTVYNNHSILETPMQAKMKYNIWINDLEKFMLYSELLKIQFDRVDKNQETLNHEIYLNHNQYRQVNNLNTVDSIKLFVSKLDTTHLAYPHNKLFLWTFENFGPVVVPKKGMEIKLNPKNYFIYKEIFNKYEGQNLDYKEGKVYRNNKLIKSYDFKHNYYFMMGDNRYRSYDSRGRGFVPEQGIEGRASIILFSKDRNNFKWDRLFRRIR